MLLAVHVQLSRLRSRYFIHFERKCHNQESLVPNVVVPFVEQQSINQESKFTHPRINVISADMLVTCTGAAQAR
jgi:hypothetical protein